MLTIGLNTAFIEAVDPATKPAPNPTPILEGSWPSHDQIDTAIDNAIRYLDQQQINGSWDKPPKPGDPASYARTSLVLATYFTTTYNHQTPELTLTKLAQQHPTDTFTAAHRAAAIANAPWQWKKLNLDVGNEMITAALHPRAPAPGLFGVSLGDTEYDHVSSYLGLAGVSASVQAGKDVPTSFWMNADKTWRSHQAADGGWAPRQPAPGVPPLPSDFRNTAAGLLALHLVAESTLSMHRPDDYSHGNIINPSIDAGMAWLDAHLPQMLADLDAGKLTNPCETACWIEQVGSAFGRPRIGGKLWAPQIARWLVQTQKPDGSWAGDVPETAYAIRFLSRVRNPILFNKLSYPPGKNNAAWNERPQDLENLTPWMEHSLCAVPLNWQIVNIDSPSREFYDAPILYITGNQEIEFSDAQAAKLREFAESGGLILGNADGASQAFSDGFIKLGTRLFPHYSFRDLPTDHPVFEEQYHAAKWRHKPKVLGLSNGVRELMILIPHDDPSVAWQLRATRVREEVFQLTSNLYLYVVGRNLLICRRGESRIIELNPAVHALKTVRIARLELGDNWNPEPAAWRQFSMVAHNDYRVDLTTENVKLGAHKLADFSIAHLTGTTKLSLDDDQRKELREFVEKGGTLIVDAAGGSVEFADSAQAELKTIFGDRAAAQLGAPLPPTHPLFAGTDAPETGIRYRNFARHVLEGNAHIPRIRAIEFEKGRLGVFFSREDLSAGLAGVDTDGIVGYEPSTARRIMASLLQFADGTHPR